MFREGVFLRTKGRKHLSRASTMFEIEITFQSIRAKNNFGWLLPSLTDIACRLLYKKVYKMILFTTKQEILVRRMFPSELKEGFALAKRKIIERAMSFLNF